MGLKNPLKQDIEELKRFEEILLSLKGFTL